MKSLSRIGLTALLFLGSTSAVGCIPPAVHEPVEESEWVTGPTERRKVTVLVRVAPPAKLRAQMVRAAGATKDEDYGEFLRQHALGGFGSGFLVVHNSGRGPRAFIVTNRHVVEGSEDAEVTFGDGTTYKNCEIVFVSTTSDLAVLALPEAAIHSYPVGLRPTTSAPTERLAVVASGFPGVNGMPSYQVTDGKISNAHFSLAGSKEDVLQHTAPIDPGSSGGPLTNEAGELVGANVALLRGRSSMFFAVPAADIAETVRKAHNVVVNRQDAALMTKALDASCNAFAAELASSNKSPEHLDHFISNELVAEEGIESYAFIVTRPEIGPAIHRAFMEDPIDTMRRSVLLRTLFRAAVSGGATGGCTSINPMDAQSITEPKPVRLALQTKGGPMELRWIFEQGAWRVVGGDLLNVNAILEHELAEARESDDAAPTPTPAPAKKAATKKVVASSSKAASKVSK